jgi:hypothetical protein
MTGGEFTPTLLRKKVGGGAHQKEIGARIEYMLNDST